MNSGASLVVSLGIAGIALAVVASFIWAIHRSARPNRRSFETAVAAIGAAVWLAIPAALAESGVLTNFDVRPPPVLAMMAALAILTSVIAFSPVGKRLATGIPVWALVGVQGFRFPLELVMHRAALEGTMPEQMTFLVGYNYDILTGATGIVLAVALYRRRASAASVALWNVLGFALLVNIVVVALLSLPLVAYWGPNRVNTWVLYFPCVWLPAVLVQAALMGHLLILRRLLSKAAHTAASPGPNVQPR